MSNYRDFHREAEEFWSEFRSHTGWDKTTTIGIAGRSVPIPVKDCPKCGKPAPIVVLDQRFVCKKCMVLFI